MARLDLTVVHAFMSMRPMILSAKAGGRWTWPPSAGATASALRALYPRDWMQARRGPVGGVPPSCSPIPAPWGIAASDARRRHERSPQQRPRRDRLRPVVRLEPEQHAPISDRRWHDAGFPAMCSGPRTQPETFGLPSRGALPGRPSPRLRSGSAGLALPGRSPAGRGIGGSSTASSSLSWTRVSVTSGPAASCRRAAAGEV